MRTFVYPNINTSITFPYVMLGYLRILLLTLLAITKDRSFVICVHMICKITINIQCFLVYFLVKEEQF